MSAEKEALPTPQEKSDNRLLRLGRTALATITGISITAGFAYVGYRFGGPLFEYLSPEDKKNGAYGVSTGISAMLGATTGLVTFALISGDPPPKNRGRVPSRNHKEEPAESKSAPPETTTSDQPAAIDPPETTGVATEVPQSPEAPLTDVPTLTPETTPPLPAGE